MAERLTPAEIAATLPLPEPAVSDAERRVHASLRTRALKALDSGLFREFWKYTPTGDFVGGLATVAVVRPELEGFGQEGISVRQLSLQESLSDAPQDDASADRFPLADLALLVAGDALIVDITRPVTQPLEIRHLDGLGMPVVIRVAPSVTVDLIERGEQSGFGNQTLYVRLGDQARLSHAYIATRPEACHWSLTQVHQAQGSHYVRQQYGCGGQRRRIELQVLLTGAEASTDIVGAFVVEDGGHLDQQLVIEHRAPATRSRQRFHGIGAGKGTAVFNGRIHIHPGAPGADAALTNRNLSLHPDAVINTKPELEIYTDDVRCSHGATVGQISEESLFYLRSRGMEVGQARRMLCGAFIRECVEGPLADAAGSALLGHWLEAGA